MNTVIEPKSQNITAFNKEVIKDCNSILTNLNPMSREQNERLKMELKYFNYFDLSAKIESILTAIQIVAYDDRSEPKDKKSVIFDLAEIVKQIFPQNEMEFLDNLFLEPTKNKSDFINLETL